MRNYNKKYYPNFNDSPYKSTIEDDSVAQSSVTLNDEEYDALSDVEEWQYIKKELIACGCYRSPKRGKSARWSPSPNSKKEIKIEAPKINSTQKQLGDDDVNGDKGELCSTHPPEKVPQDKSPKKRKDDDDFDAYLPLQKFVADSDARSSQIDLIVIRFLLLHSFVCFN